VNYFCLIQSEQFVLALSWQEQISFHWEDDDVHFVLNKHP
jgi:hypothetical protein